MPIQKRNDEHSYLHAPDLLPNDYADWHEPIGGFGAWNGQFECGPDDAPEGWELYSYAGGTIGRINGGVCGNYRICAGHVGAGTGGYLLSNRYFMVSENREYFIGGVLWANDVAATAHLGLVCYDVTKTFLAYAWAVSVNPGLTPVRYQKRIGPLGDVAWPANTRYARIVVILQLNAALIGAYSYCDDIQFAPIQAATSSTLTLISSRLDVTGPEAFTLQAYTLFPGCQMNIALEETSYIWYSFHVSMASNTVRVTAYYIGIFIDGVQDTQVMQIGQPVGNIQHLWSSGMVRSAASYIAGTHTLDFRVYVQNAGDIVTGRHFSLSAWTSRRW